MTAADTISVPGDRIIVAPPRISSSQLYDRIMQLEGEKASLETSLTRMTRAKRKLDRQSKSRRQTIKQLIAELNETLTAAATLVGPELEQFVRDHLRDRQRLVERAEQAEAERDRLLTLVADLTGEPE